MLRASEFVIEYGRGFLVGLEVRNEEASELMSSEASLKIPAATYSHGACRPTTIGAAVFHFRVRNGTGWGHCALATGF